MKKVSFSALCLFVVASLAACGGGGSSNPANKLDGVTDFGTEVTSGATEVAAAQGAVTGVSGVGGNINADANGAELGAVAGGASGALVLAGAGGFGIADSGLRALVNAAVSKFVDLDAECAGTYTEGDPATVSYECTEGDDTISGTVSYSASTGHFVAEVNFSATEETTTFSGQLFADVTATPPEPEDPTLIDGDLGMTLSMHFEEEGQSGDVEFELGLRLVEVGLTDGEPTSGMLQFYVGLHASAQGQSFNMEIFGSWNFETNTLTRRCEGDEEACGAFALR